MPETRSSRALITCSKIYRVFNTIFFPLFAAVALLAFADSIFKFLIISYYYYNGLQRYFKSTLLSKSSL